MIDSLNKLWRIFLPSERRKVLWMLLLVVVMAGVETLGVLSITPFLSVLGRPEVIEENPVLSAAYDYLDFTSNQDFVVALGLASIILVVGSSAFKIVTQHLINRFVHLQRHILSARLLSKYLQQPYEFFLDRNPAVLSKNVLSEVDQLVFELIKPLSQLVAQGAIVVCMGFLILLYDPLMAVGIVGFVVLIYVVIYRVFRTWLEGIGKERREANGKRYQACSEVLGGIKDVKVTQSTSSYQRKFDISSRLFSRHTAANETLNQSPLYLVEAAAYGGLIVIALVLLIRSDDIAYVLPILGLYGFSAYRMLPAAQIMFRGFAKLKFNMASLDAIYEDLALPSAIETSSNSPMALSKEIKISDVRYAYPTASDKPVLENFNLTIPVNSCVGIVGKSGSGKSTLMDVLLGLLTPQSGEVLIDGTPLGPENIQSWQRSVGYVPQHIYLADASIKENIAFGVPLPDINMPRVERAARAAQLHEFVLSELEAGYDTMVGDRGVRLSGGQCQRVGIARALYRNPVILLLDEATSALDGETEDSLGASVRELYGMKTIVLISHREASLVQCDELVDIQYERKGKRHPLITHQR
ncbi:ABC transporter ATP-binding protein [Parahaliea mediterranea]|uniref:ABC transporter ATP-binding protein n=1 Tax=Parahaliea mediterranea TaxID=651086 RepID=A0A939DC59_9GAMM|nr:ABC transporter ATP-binding protein [Parahaliea mediterranea]MBN7795485.1 ABC transporter ATP-binding protein [Parahaliea mediterranea]